MTTQAKEKTEHWYDWEEFHTVVWELAKRIRAVPQHKQLRGIVAISRGGLIPATLLSHYLKLPIVDVLLVASYTGKTSGEVRVYNHLHKQHYTLDSVIFVDDIIDTGNTATAILGSYPEVRFVAPIAKSPGLDKLPGPAIFVMPPRVHPRDQWVVFPWEEKPL